jgi:hypothetical protein
MRPPFAPDPREGEAALSAPAFSTKANLVDRRVAFAAGIQAMKTHARKGETVPEITSAMTPDTEAVAVEERPAWCDGRDMDASPENGINSEKGYTQQILYALTAFRNGEFSRRLPVEWTGVHGKIADVFNEILAFSERRANETARICRMVGKEGKLEQRMAVPGVTGGWVDEIQALNTLIADLARPTA